MFGVFYDLTKVLLCDLGPIYSFLYPSVPKHGAKTGTDLLHRRSGVSR